MKNLQIVEDSVEKSVKFNEVAGFIPSIWTSGNEWIWFQKAWEILEKYRLTRYENFIERGKVFVRAVAVAMIYIDFCKISLGESHWYEDLYSEFENIFSDGEVDISFLYARLSNETYYPGLKEAVCELTDVERPKILKILIKEMNTAKICLGMYCTSIDCDYLIDYSDEDDEEDDYSLIDTSNYDTYWESIDKNFHEIVDIYFDDLMEAYEWLENGADRVTDLD